MSLVAGAKKYALLMCWIINLLGLDRLCLLAHLDMRYLTNSQGRGCREQLGPVVDLYLFILRRSLIGISDATRRLC